MKRRRAQARERTSGRRQRRDARRARRAPRAHALASSPRSCARAAPLLRSRRSARARRERHRGGSRPGRSHARLPAVDRETARVPRRRGADLRQRLDRPDASAARSGRWRNGDPQRRERGLRQRRQRVGSASEGPGAAALEQRRRARPRRARRRVRDPAARATTSAAVGGRVVLLDGTLQEAGSIVWRDGSCAGYGRGDDPDARALPLPARRRLLLRRLPDDSSRPLAAARRPRRRVRSRVLRRGRLLPARQGGRLARRLRAGGGGASLRVGDRGRRPRGGAAAAEPVAAGRSSRRAARVEARAPSGEPAEARTADERRPAHPRPRRHGAASVRGQRLSAPARDPRHPARSGASRSRSIRRSSPTRTGAWWPRRCRRGRGHAATREPPGSKSSSAERRGLLSGAAGEPPAQHEDRRGDPRAAAGAVRRHALDLRRRGAVRDARPGVGGAPWRPLGRGGGRSATSRPRSSSRAAPIACARCRFASATSSRGAEWTT